MHAYQLLPPLVETLTDKWLILSETFAGQKQQGERLNKTVSECSPLCQMSHGICCITHTFNVLFSLHMCSHTYFRVFACKVRASGHYV